jgi:hypothetical protein
LNWTLGRMVSPTSPGQLAGCTKAAGLVAVSWALSLAQVQAQQTQSNAPPPEQSTVIRGEFVEVHDFLSDDNAPASPRTASVEWSHGFTMTLSGKNQVAEKWNGNRLRIGSKPSPLTSQDQSNGMTGQNAGHIVWHILEKNKLQRIYKGQHFLMIMDIEVSAGKECHVEVKYLKQTGFVSVVMKRIDTGTMANFSLPRVESASCTIEATRTQ